MPAAERDLEGARPCPHPSHWSRWRATPVDRPIARVDPGQRDAAAAIATTATAVVDGVLTSRRTTPTTRGDHVPPRPRGRDGRSRDDAVGERERGSGTTTAPVSATATTASSRVSDGWRDDVAWESSVATTDAPPTSAPRRRACRGAASRRRGPRRRRGPSATMTTDDRDGEHGAAMRRHVASPAATIDDRREDRERAARPRQPRARRRGRGRGRDAGVHRVRGGAQTDPIDVTAVPPRASVGPRAARRRPSRMRTIGGRPRPRPASWVTSRIVWPPACSRREQLHDLLATRGVERAGRLVGQQQRRLVRERPGDREALALAAGQHAGHR